MISKVMTNRMKAAAVAAVMCLSATAFCLPSYVNMTSITASAAAVSIGKELAVGDKYEGFTADVGTSGVKTITFTLKANYTGNFSYGFGIGVADAPYWYEWDGKTWVDTEGGKVEVPGVSVPVKEGENFTITVDTSKLGLSYNPSSDKYPGKFEFRNYYSGEGKTDSVTLVSAEANASSTSTPAPTEPTGKPDPTQPTDKTDPTQPTDKTDPTQPADKPDKPSGGTASGQKLAVDDTYQGFTADLAASGIKNITITVTPDFTGNFTYGFGIGTADDPYWYEWDGKGWQDTEGGKIDVPGTDVPATAGKDVVIVIDTSKLSLSYNPSTDKYPGKFEFRNYYSGEEDGSVTIKSIVANGDATPTPPGPADPGEPGKDPSGGGDGHELSNKDGNSKNPLANGKGWSFKDNGNGTGTMTATQARQIEFEKPLTLTQGYDEEYYAKEGKSPVEGTDPINSHKFGYSDFGLSGIGKSETGSTVIESIMATIQSKQSVKNFMYGGGLNVENKSPADTESAKAEKGVATTEDAGYWYNDMGEEKVEEFKEAGVEFGVEPSYGYFLSSEDNQLGGYFNVFWDVPEEVKPYETAGDISFQYWYGVEDTEEYTEIPAVDLVGGVLTYTEEQTFDYTASKKAELNQKISAGDMSEEISFVDSLGLEANDDVHAVVFTVSADSDLDKLVYGIGASVGDDWQMWAPEGAEWNFVATNTTSGDVEIAWIVPSGLDLNEEYGNLQFGYWYGGQGETELDSVTLKSVEVFYNEKEEATEPPTEPPTTAPTDAPTEPDLKVTKWGDTDCNDSVDILDVILLNRNILGKSEVTPQGKVNSDIDVNDKLEPADALNIMKLIVKILSNDDCPVKASQS